MPPTLLKALQDCHHLLSSFIPLLHKCLRVRGLPIGFATRDVLIFKVLTATGIFQGLREYRNFFLLWLLCAGTLCAQAKGASSSAIVNIQERQLQETQQQAKQMQMEALQSQLVDSVERKPNTQPCLHQPGQSPEMVVIQGGEFVMGSPDAETESTSDEGPQHRVWVQPFAMGRCEITVAEFRLFTSETGYQTQAEIATGVEQDELGCQYWDEELRKVVQVPETNWRRPGFAQNEKSPVTCVGWKDARAYAAWISLRTGVKYRLPTEAEWEYAARAGTTTPFNTGKCIDSLHANFDTTLAFGDCSADTVHLQKTTEVGTFPANQFGLKDVHGNVWEWTQDCWHKSYNSAPENGAAWHRESNGDCSIRVVRGGSWGMGAKYLRSASRGENETGFHFSIYIGFRLARTLSTEAMVQEQAAAAK